MSTVKMELRDLYYKFMPEWTTKYSPFGLGYNYAYYFRRPDTFLRDCFDRVKWFVQRGYRGWADCDVWSLDGYLARWLPAALDRLLTNKQGHPVGMTRKGWDTRLKRMKRGFVEAQKIMDMKYRNPKEAQAAIKRMERDLNVFTKHFLSLWD